MSNPFLSYGSGGGDLSGLQNGTTPINVASVTDQSLIPGLPVAASSTKGLTSRLLGPADLNFSIVNPTLTSAGGTTLVNDGTGPALAVKGLTAGAGITFTESATDITIASAAGTVTTLTSAGGASSLVSNGTGPDLAIKGVTAGTGGIIVTDAGSYLEIEYDDAPLLALEDKTQNISAIGGRTEFAGTIAAATLIANIAPLVATGTFIADSATVLQEVAGARFTIIAPALVVKVGVPIIHWPAGNTAITRRFNIWTDVGVLVAGYDLPKTTILGQYYTLDVSITLPAGTYRYAIDRGIGVADVQFAAIPGVTFDSRVSNVGGVIATGGYGIFPSTVGPNPNRVFTGMVFFGVIYPGVVEAPILKGNGATAVTLGSDLDLAGVYSLLRVLKINGLGPTGGVYSETPSANYVGIVAETNIITSAAGYGSVAVPAGEFQPGDCYSLKIGGIITCNNNNLWTVRVRSNFGGAAPVTFATFAVTASTNLAARWWELEVEFSVRAIGAAGVASMSTNGNFTYVDANAFTRGTGSNAVISTVFNTTILNTLSVTYQGSDATITVFQPTQIVLARVF